jgi:hypothetical protein
LGKGGTPRCRMQASFAMVAALQYKSVTPRQEKAIAVCTI